MPQWFVYVIEKQRVYYTGITTNPTRRLHQHKLAVLKYIEPQPDAHAAARRERQIKGWTRAKKEQLWTAGSRVSLP